MSVYENGSSAIRDTVKWLVAFVPAASLISGGTALGPAVIKGIDEATSVPNYLDHHGWTLAGLVAVVVGLGAIVVLGARVLASAPTDFVRLLGDRAVLGRAIGAGVGSPYFTDEEEFREALVALRLSVGETAETPAMKATATTAEDLRAWAWFDRTLEPFRVFKYGLVIGLVLILSGFIAITADKPETTSTALAFERATPVDVALTDEAAFRDATGCDAQRSTTFTAIGGTWTSPLLAVEGPGCRFAQTWRPGDGTADLRPVSG